MNKKLFPYLFLISIFSSVYSQSIEKLPETDFNSYFKPAKWRCIGPFRGGRSVASCGVINDPLTYYMGTTGGGLWKTQDMGITWGNISDGFFKTGTVGAISVAESDPNIIYVGMGEHAIRGVMTHGGDGVYKSTDAGKTWKNIGLELTQHISRIIIDPKNPDIVFVAAQGALYSNSTQRGLYKSTDGGENWKNVLYVDDKTGCAEISIDANNSRILYAAMWEHGRKPWQVISGGKGSGLYKSTDSGEHWEKMSEGLPEDMGKMSIAVCPTNSEKVYALIESDWDKEAGGLYVSNNSGKSWSQVTSDHRLIQRAWYYIELFIDPNNENTLYVLSAPSLRSLDGGKTWQDISGTHGDYHNLWINPKNSNNMIISDDGGAAISFNKAKSWSSQNIYPTGQFYRINVDNLFPYNIYAGQQDNSSVKIASRNRSGGGITKDNWSYSAGGESAFLAFNPNDPRYVMGGSYQGSIEVLDTKANIGTSIMAAPIQYLGRDAKDMKYRFNWNAPIIRSEHEENTFYHGSQYLLRTTDMGQTWTETSPDLTRNEKEKQGRPGVPYTNEAVGAENYGTLSYVKESSLEKGVIYTGSDDGLVYLTKDNGKTWKNITPLGLQECLINAIEVSPFDKATAYIATTRYKFNDHTPSLYKTTDYGKTWKKITNGIPSDAFTRVIREDDKNKNLLFAGTEKGLYVSFNGGIDWKSFQLNLPIAPITDLKVYQNNLIASTSGRAFWILDDLELIRQYNKDLKDKTFLFKSSPVGLTNSYSELDQTDEEFTGMNSASGVNPASGLVVYYQLPELKNKEEIALEIKDIKGNLVHSYSSKADSIFKTYDGGPRPEALLSNKKGLNRFVWDLRHATMTGVPGVYIEANYRGHRVSPGKYSVTLKVGTETFNSEATIIANPLYEVSENQYQLYHENMLNMEIELNAMHLMINNLYSKQEQLSTLLNSISKETKYKEIITEGETLVKKMKDWDANMIQRKSKAYDDVENFPNKFTSDYLFLINQSDNDLAKISQPSKDLLKEYNDKWEVLKTQGNELLEKELPLFNKKLWEAGIGAVWTK